MLEIDAVRLNGSAGNLLDAVREAGSLLVESGAVSTEYIDSMLLRELEHSTYVGNQLAVPHGTSGTRGLIIRSGLSFVRYDEPVDWGGRPVRFVVGIAGKDGHHLEMLARMAIAFSDLDVIAKLAAAESAEVVLSVLGDVRR